MSERLTYRFEPGDGVPPPVGPFAHAVEWGDTLYVTGQMPTEPVTGRLVEGDLVAQARQVRDKLLAVLAPFGATLDDALMVRVYLADSPASRTSTPSTRPGSPPRYRPGRPWG